MFLSIPPILINWSSLRPLGEALGIVFYILVCRLNPMTGLTKIFLWFWVFPLTLVSTQLCLERSSGLLTKAENKALERKLMCSCVALRVAGHLDAYLTY